MSGIRQYQRRAIEALQLFWQPFEICGGQKFFIQDQEVFFLGISKGIGICSDIHDKDVAVFDEAMSLNKMELPVGRILMSGAILLKYLNDAVFVVEALAIKSADSHRVVFEKTGRQQTYIHI